MKPTPETAEALNACDVQFFIKSPTQFPRLDAVGFRMASITKSTWPYIENLTELVTTLKPFFEDADKRRFLVGVVRTRAETAHKAISQAVRIMDHYLDSLAVAGFCIPVLAPAVIVRRADEPDGRIMEFHRDKWLEARPSTDAPRELWNARSVAMMQRLEPFLSQVVEASSDQYTELGWRALHSAKLFRRGVESKGFGLEFFCKFAALENLVMGGESSEKRKKFRARLEALVGTSLPNGASLIDELWKRRHPLVHEARVEFIHDDPEAFPVHVHMEALNWLFQVTFVFLSDHIASISSLTSLWDLAADYYIPEKICDTRPSEIFRFPASSWTETSGIVWKGAGNLIDRLWAVPSKSSK